MGLSEESGITGLSATHTNVVRRVCRIIETAEKPPTLAELAGEACLSQSHLRRVFKTATGLTPKEYSTHVRAERLREGLSTAASVSEAVYEAGFQSAGRFYENAEDILGMKPGEYRAGGAGSTIRFAVGECSLGSVLVAASEVGICAILLGDDPQDLVDDLQQRFRSAEIVGADENFEQLVSIGVGLVESPGTAPDLPLDIRGTAFQRRVWSALKDIPTGKTASYAEIARRIGSPSSTRAVAGACAANSLAVAIPCHRVVRTDGGLSGYRWGIERKRELLDREARGTSMERG